MSAPVDPTFEEIADAYRCATSGEDAVVLDVPCRHVSTDADGTEWFKLSPEDYWGSTRNWAASLARHRRSKK